eukprot:Plantae.Rhodophyta-Purpureofilum_apyrenoidigerum.ctg37512.p2 GENE.Plantae.Rhodophyta-Purpureofilum_apyrenoidigerum.ctg37512~~Plantae.Rhodophyta-Purpureofilum_apyrenoidigerum.ctg37512.p2  ORF type:complete len:169 (+),score=31.18 Plantae.Rhodophyta-Purpureofilum_apyrenoidigerum.ctg37512:76-582(+)
MLGFLSDGGSKQKPKTAPYTAAVAFLTNVFYMLYLALRVQNRSPPTKQERDTTLMRVAESKYLPISMVVSAGICLLWAAFGRPDGDFGEIAARWDALVSIVNQDRLAVTFVIDCALYALLQGALVPDDMARRGFKDNFAQIVAAVVPYFGLAYYFWVRPPLKDLEETS